MMTSSYVMMMQFVNVLFFPFSRDLLQISPELVQRLYEALLKECKKESLTYRSVAIRVLSIFAHRFDFSIYELFWSWFEKAFKLPVSK